MATMASTAAAAEVTAVCPGDGTVQLRVRFWADELGADWQGVVVERREVGDCGTGVILTSEPLQLLDGLDLGDYELTYAVPSLLTAYRYAARGLDAGGNLVDLVFGYYPTSVVVKACVDDALMMRGTLHDIGEFGTVGIELCTGSCWEICPATATVGVHDLDPADYTGLLDTGTVVNVYGVWDSLPPQVSWGCVDAVRLETVADCLGAVPTDQTSWGSLKGSYR
jgi:hypothetical protein